MKNSTKLLLAIGAGAVAGYYLNSDQGRKARKTAADNLQKTADETSVKVNELTENVKGILNELTGQAKDYMNRTYSKMHELAETTQKNIAQAEQVAEAKMKSFKKASANGINQTV